MRWASATVSIAALNIDMNADALEDAQRKAQRAIRRAEAAREEITRAREDIREADRAQEDAKGRMALARFAREAAEQRLVTSLLDAVGRGAAAAAAVQLADAQYRDAEREPPEHWPWWAKEWFKVGRGTVTAADGTLQLGEAAVENPEKVPGTTWGLAERTYDDPLGTGKALIGYDELASGRYSDWLGQGLFAGVTGGVGASTSRTARLGRLHGSPRLQQLGRVAPQNGARFAGRRMDFTKPDLNKRPGTDPVKLTEAKRVQLAERYPAGVRFTRAGYPVFTPYAVERVVVDNLTGNRRSDEDLANDAADLPDTPDDFVWHHVEDGRTMELVPEDLHENARHTGGAADIHQARADGITPGSEFSPFERNLGRSVGGAGGTGALAGASEGSPP